MGTKPLPLLRIVKVSTLGNQIRTCWVSERLFEMDFGTPSPVSFILTMSKIPSTAQETVAPGTFGGRSPFHQTMVPCLAPWLLLGTILHLFLLWNLVGPNRLNCYFLILVGIPHLIAKQFQFPLP